MALAWLARGATDGACLEVGGLVEVEGVDVRVAQRVPG